REPVGCPGRGTPTGKSIREGTEAKVGTDLYRGKQPHRPHGGIRHHGNRRKLNYRGESSAFRKPGKNSKKICVAKCLHIYLQTNDYALKLRRDVFQAIADPTRRAILLLLASQSMTAGAIASNFDSSR